MTTREQRERDPYNYEVKYLRETVFHLKSRAAVIRAAVKLAYDAVQRERCRELRRDAA